MVMKDLDIFGYYEIKILKPWDTPDLWASCYLN